MGKVVLIGSGKAETRLEDVLKEAFVMQEIFVIVPKPSTMDFPVIPRKHRNKNKPYSTKFK